MKVKEILWVWREELILAAYAFLIVMGFRHLPDVVVPFVVSIVLGYVSMPVIHCLERLFRRFTRRDGEGVPVDMRAYAVTAFFLLGFLVLLLALVPLVFGLITQLQDLGDLLTREGVARYAERAADLVESLKSRVKQFPYLNQSVEVLQASREKIVEALTRTLGSAGEGTRKFLGNTAAGLISSVGRVLNWALVPALLFYVLLDWERMVQVFHLLIPDSYAPWARRFAGKVDRTLRNYMRGQVVVATIFGLLMTLGLTIIRIPYALVIGPIAGVANLVPYLGIVVGLVPSILISFITWGWSWATVQSLIGLLVVYLVIQTIDGYVLQPRITARLVNLHPMLIILAVVVGGKLMGLYGLLLAVPAAAILKELFHDAYALLYSRRWPYAEPD